VTERAFRYARDPLFIAACLLYAANRLLVKPHVTSAFFRGHFNDLLLIPCALPPVLWIQRRLGIRHHDQRPLAGEIAAHLCIWALIAEGVGPYWLHRGVSDPYDVLVYIAGAVIAYFIWARSYRVAAPRHPASDPE
jgi:hypothetical protein